MVMQIGPTVPDYYCHTCGKHHDELPFAYGTDAPDAWLAIPANERLRRGELSSDQCVIDNEFFFVRGNLEIPVIGQATPSREAFGFLSAARIFYAARSFGLRRDARKSRRTSVG